MSVAEETLKDRAARISRTKQVSIVNRILDFLSSVRFGVTLLCGLVLLALIGMLVVQQNVNGFDAYFASRTPAEKYIYGALGIFDIYHSWYFNFLLLVLSLNIILASIDRFPRAFSYIRAPKWTATRGWLLRQKQNAILHSTVDEKKQAEQVKEVFKANGFSAKITEDVDVSYGINADGRKDFSAIVSRRRLYVFGESGKWNRLGAYLVHVFLLTLFLGHFVALQTGFDADIKLTNETNPTLLNYARSVGVNAWQNNDTIELIQFNLDQQERFNVKLPFTITCTDIEQDLIDPNGSIEINNTLDWHTRIKIDDPIYGETIADVSLNRPFEYRGYRFFQASAITVGSARMMTLELTPQNGGAPVQVNLARSGAASLPDGTKIEYEGFFPDFILNQGKPDTRSADFNNPAAVVNVTTPNGEQKRAYAFGNKLPDNIPIGAPVAGYKWRLKDFQKSPFAHVLSIKYDPFNAAFIAWYIGGFGLIGALIFVFFLSHKRVWALIDDENNEIVLGGDTNRNDQGFQDKFAKVVADLRQKQIE